MDGVIEDAIFASDDLCVREMDLIVVIDCGDSNLELFVNNSCFIVYYCYHLSNIVPIIRVPQ